MKGQISSETAATPQPQVTRPNLVRDQGTLQHANDTPTTCWSPLNDTATTHYQQADKMLMTHQWHSNSTATACQQHANDTPKTRWWSIYYVRSLMTSMKDSYQVTKGHRRGRIHNVLYLYGIIWCVAPSSIHRVVCSPTRDDVTFPSTLLNPTEELFS